jgi:UDP-glucose 4-epimerase
MNKKVIVTGGYGFIGSNLVDTLVKNGVDVVVIDNLSTGNKNYHNDKATYLIKDIRDDFTENIERGDFDDTDAIIHLAGLARIQPSFKDPTEFLSVNTQGTVNMCDLANQILCRFVYAGSSSFYGGPENSPYAFSKWQGEEVTKMYNKLFKVPASVARFFNVFGPRHTTEGAYATVVGVFQRQYLSGEPITITWDGEQRRDFTHVNNIVRGLIKMSESNFNGEVFNLGTANNYSINELANMFGESYPKVYIPKRPGDARSTLADLSFSKEKLGYEPIEKLEIYLNEWLGENKK